MSTVYFLIYFEQVWSHVTIHVAPSSLISVFFALLEGFSLPLDPLESTTLGVESEHLFCTTLQGNCCLLLPEGMENELHAEIWYHPGKGWGASSALMNRGMEIQFQSSLINEGVDAGGDGE